MHDPTRIAQWDTMSLSALFTITDPVSLPPPDAVHVRNGIYRIDAHVDQRGAVSWFEGVRQDTAHAAPVRVAREPNAHAERSALFGWPSIGWEVEIRNRAQHLGIPRIIDQFVDGQHLWLVIEDPIGVSLWD